MRAGVSGGVAQGGRPPGKRIVKVGSLTEARETHRGVDGGFQPSSTMGHVLVLLRPGYVASRLADAMQTCVKARVQDVHFPPDYYLRIPWQPLVQPALPI